MLAIAKQTALLKALARLESRSNLPLLLLTWGMFAVVFPVASTPAAEISWNLPVNVGTNAGNSSDIDTSFGTMIEAFTATTPNSPIAGIDVTVNGVTFVATTDLLAGTQEATSDFSSSTNGGDTAYDNLLSSLEYGGGGELFTINIGDGDGNSAVDSGGNLVPGSLYQLQVWFVDDRAASDDRFMQFGDGNGNTVAINDQYAIGTFIADAATQDLTLDALGFGNAHFNAYALSGEIQLPEIQVNTASGDVTLVNNSSAIFDMNFYQLTSHSGALDPAEWLSIQEGAGAAAGFMGGTGVGNGWEILGDPEDPTNPPNDSMVAETFILGSSELSTGESISFGPIYDTVAPQDLEFQIQLAEGLVLDLPVIEVFDLEADFDGDGDVDGEDLTDPTLGWQANYGSIYSGDDFLSWQREFISNPSPPLVLATTVPEPTAIALAGVVAAMGIFMRFQMTDVN